MREPYFDDDPPPARESPCGTLKELPSGGMIARLARAPAAGRDPRTMTPGQLRRHRRNLMIALGAKVGLSGRFLADAFALPRSRIAAILREYEAGAAEVAAADRAG